MPITAAADIYVEEAFYNIRYYAGKCFTTTQTGTCLPEVCQCSSRGLWYSHSFNVTQPDGFIYIKCSMLFDLREVYSDSLKVRIVEFSSPRIRPNENFPLSSGYLVTFSCNVDITNYYVTFQWDCLNNESVDTMIEETTNQSSTITRKLHLKHDNQTCTCISNVDGYIANAYLRVYVSKVPVLQINDSRVCNDSFSTSISCTISTEFSMYGFDMWEHTFRGIYIRSLKGKVDGRRSSLTIASCRFQDAGDYRCYGWTNVNGETFSANKSVSLYINGPPLIVSATKRLGQNVTLSVLFCSSSYPDPMWLHLGTPIKNSTQMTQILYNTSLPIQVYNVTVMCAGYMTNLTTELFMAGRFVACLKNDFGEVRKTFLVNLKKSKGFMVSFDFRSIIIGITALGICIVTSSVTVVLMKGRRKSSVVHVVGPHELSTIPIYHSAPSAEPVIHIYDSANAGYLEVIDYASSQSHYSERNNKESGDGVSNTTTNEHDYEEID
ncbi:Hypothetical predicted protein [Mytilus galloprovincialis]|uniref:Ig-like domain-containing protein n=1 Tax=Mytilus galloprovincialis TaxID=29158 RepID=A0A8B6FUS3_MYTGA|nr:Hypothetical predicted protein [Mytilus galloprovincialis]